MASSKDVCEEHGVCILFEIGHIEVECAQPCYEAEGDLPPLLPNPSTLEAIREANRGTHD